MFENEIKGENMEIKTFLHKSPSKIGLFFRHRIHSLLRRADDRGSAITSFAVGYLTHITSLRVRHDYLNQKVGHA